MYSDTKYLNNLSDNDIINLEREFSINEVAALCHKPITEAENSEQLSLAKKLLDSDNTCDPVCIEALNDIIWYCNENKETFFS